MQVGPACDAARLQSLRSSHGEETLWCWVPPEPTPARLPPWARPRPAGRPSPLLTCSRQFRLVPTRSPFGSTIRARTSPLVPVPRGDQAVPFQRAMLLTATPPAAEKSPPAIRSPLGRVVTVSTRLQVTPDTGAARPIDEAAIDAAQVPTTAVAAFDV